MKYTTWMFTVSKNMTNMIHAGVEDVVLLIIISKFLIEIYLTVNLKEPAVKNLINFVCLNDWLEVIQTTGNKDVVVHTLIHTVISNNPVGSEKGKNVN